MSLVYTPAKKLIMQGAIDFREAGADIRVLLVMAQFVQAQNAANLAALTLDEYNGSGYSRKALTTQAVTEDDTNHLAYFDADNVVWTGLGAGTRQAIAVIVYRYVDGTAANDYPIVYIDSGFPVNGNGGNLTISWNASGILQLV